MECFVYKQEGRAKQVKRLRNIQKTKGKAGVMYLTTISNQALSGLNLLMNESSKCKAQLLDYWITCPTHTVKCSHVSCRRPLDKDVEHGHPASILEPI